MLAQIRTGLFFTSIGLFRQMGRYFSKTSVVVRKLHVVIVMPTSSVFPAAARSLSILTRLAVQDLRGAVEAGAHRGLQVREACRRQRQGVVTFVGPPLLFHLIAPVRAPEAPMIDAIEPGTPKVSAIWTEVGVRHNEA